MKKILFVTSNLGIGGAQQHLILLANYLHEKNYKVLIINTDNNNDFVYRLNQKIELINIPRKYSYDLSPSKGIAQIIAERGLTTIFCDSIFAYLFIFKLASKKNIKISIIFHLTNYVDNYNYIKDLAVRFLLKRNVQLIGIAKNQIAHLSKVLLIPAKRFKLIYNGVDRTNFSYKDRLNLRNSELRESLGIPEKAFVIVKAARFAVEKNHELAIELLRILREKHGFNAYLLLLGNTNKTRMNLIADLAQSNNLSRYVKMAGLQKDVKPYLAISDLFILTSKSVETFSIAALEAMAMGLPAVLTDVGGAKEMVFDGQNGYVVPYTDPQRFADRVLDVANNKLQLDNKKISDLILERFSLDKTNKELEQYIF